MSRNRLASYETFCNSFVILPSILPGRIQRLGEIDFHELGEISKGRARRILLWQAPNGLEVRAAPWKGSTELLGGVESSGDLWSFFRAWRSPQASARTYQWSK